MQLFFWKKSVWLSFGRTIMGKAIWEDLIETWLGEGFQIGNVSLYIVKVDYSDHCMWMTSNWLEKNKILIRQQRSRLRRTNIFPGSCILAMHSTTMPNKQRYCGQLQNHVRISNFRGESRKITFPLKIFVFLHGLMKWLVMQIKCVERYCELANKTTQQLCNVSTPCIDDRHFKEEEMKSVGDLSQVCSQIVLECLFVARIGRLYILWSVNKFSRSITNWTKSLWQTPESIEFMFSSYIWIQKKLSCG